MPTGRCIQRFETFLTGTSCSRICFPEISRLSKGRLQIMAAGILGMNPLGHLCSTTLDLPARNILAQVYEWKKQLHQFRLVQDRDLWLRWHLWLLKLHEHFRRRHLRCFEFEFWNWWHCRTDLQTRCQEDGTCHRRRHEVHRWHSRNGGDWRRTGRLCPHCRLCRPTARPGEVNLAECRRDGGVQIRSRCFEPCLGELEGIHLGRGKFWSRHARRLAGPADSVFLRQTVGKKMDRVHGHFIFLKRMKVLGGRHSGNEQRLALGRWELF